MATFRLIIKLQAGPFSQLLLNAHSRLWTRLAPLFVAWALLYGVTLCGGTAAQADNQPGEYEVKAAFLYNFAKFVEWPAGAFASQDSPFSIAVVGDDPFGPALDKVVAGKAIDGHRITLKRFRRAADIQTCHVLFVSQSEKGNWARIHSALGTSSTLTVSDIHPFVQRGGMIQFILEARKVRFDICDDAGARAHLKMSSKLLQLARNVTCGGR